MSAMRVVCYVGGRPVRALDPLDRGLAYGDGLFETIRVWRGQPLLWREHLARLRRGARRLGLHTDWDWLQSAALAHAGPIEDGVQKLILTRGAGGRGYAPPLHAEPLLVLAAFDPPSPPPPEGLRLRWCRTRMALQPELAGIKHLNRLEQVLARAEWNDPRIDEGLVCDSRGRVVCATAANLFVLRDGRWLTPPVDECGIAGTLRAWLLRRIEACSEAALMPVDVAQADAVFLCNSLRGILPVRRLGPRRYAPHPELIALRRRVLRRFPAFA